MIDNNQIVENVQKWYSEHWESLKGANCVDYRLIQHGNLLDGKKVLNIGCFYPSDELTFASRTSEWVSIDFTPQVIDRCINLKIPHVVFKLMDARHLDFDEKHFDIVLDFSSGDQMPEAHYDEVILQVHKVLKPGGLFIVAFANFNYFKVAEVHGDFGYSRFYSPPEFIAKITSSGFKFVSQLDENSDRVGMIFEVIH